MKRILCVGLLFVIASCGGGDSTSSSVTESVVGDTTVVEPAVSEPAVSEPVVTDPVATEWVQVDAPSDCMCSDGSPFSYFVREADPSKVVFYLEGGGACFSADMCAPGSDQYTHTFDYPDGFTGTDGIFDLDNPENPFADYSFVYVPYCTGDVHTGNTTKDYGNGVVVQHKGFVNASTALDDMIARFPAATNVVVAGASAGSFPTPIYAAMVGDALPTADLKVVADGSGAIPDAMGLVVANWGTLEALPDWPELVGLTVDQVTPSTIFEKAALHNPNITMARHDYAHDRVLSGYATMAGLSADNLVDVMNANEAKVEANGAAVATWIAAGDDHTIIGRPSMYTEEQNGVRFVDWLKAFIDGSPLPDEHCTVCD